MAQKLRILFVCMGNICRSPTAEGVFRQLVREYGYSHCFEIDSAGTTDSHAGEPPDSRAQQTAKGRGIDISRLKARKVNTEDYGYFDYILAMDRDNLAYLARKCPNEFQHKLGLFLAHAPGLGIDEVPDPYYGPRNGFDRVFDMMGQAAGALLEQLIIQHELHPER